MISSVLRAVQHTAYVILTAETFGSIESIIVSPAMNRQIFANELGKANKPVKSIMFPSLSGTIDVLIDWMDVFNHHILRVFDLFAL